MGITKGQTKCFECSVREWGGNKQNDPVMDRKPNKSGQPMDEKGIVYHQNQVWESQKVKQNFRMFSQGMGREQTK